jgi:hypothetical protein
MPWNFKSDELGPSDLPQVLEAGEVDAFFSGHVHSYQRIAEEGFRYQELIVGTAGAPQDDPTLVSGGPNGQYTPDVNLTVLAYAGGAGASVRFGYVLIDVHADGSIKTELKVLDDPMSSTSTISTFDAAKIAPGGR